MNRGKQIRGLATPLARNPLTPISPNILTSTPLSYRQRMENTRKFLESLKTPPANNTSNSTLEENDDLGDETLPEESNPVMDPPSAVIANDVEKDKQRGGHVEFENIGFFSICDQDDELDDVNKESSEVPVPRLDVETVAMESISETPVVPTPREATENVVDDTNPRDENEVGNNNNTEDQEPSSSSKKRTAEEEPSSLGKGKSKKKKSKGKTVNEARREVVETAKKGSKSKSSRAAKKGFKDSFQTLKFKISSINSRNGSCPDFALFVFDNVHNPDARPSAPHAGKYLTYTKALISTQFFFKRAFATIPKTSFSVKMK